MIGDLKWMVAEARCTTANAVTAVAVESALLDSSPTQWPSGERAASSSSIARVSAEWRRFASIVSDKATPDCAGKNPLFAIGNLSRWRGLLF